MLISFLFQKFLQDLFDLAQMVDMDRICHVEKKRFYLFFDGFDFSQASLNTGLVLCPFEFDIDGKDALFVDELPDDFRIVDDVYLRPELEVNPHQQIVKL